VSLPVKLFSLTLLPHNSMVFGSVVLLIGRVSVFGASFADTPVVS
jgi:hypothetical protein